MVPTLIYTFAIRRVLSGRVMRNSIMVLYKEFITRMTSLGNVQVSLCNCIFKPTILNQMCISLINLTLHGENNSQRQHFWRRCWKNYIYFQDQTFLRGFTILSLAPKVSIQKKITGFFGNFSQHGGGGRVFPNPKTFVNLPSIFLCAKFILRC